jgi:hypothetical protein
MKRVTWFVAGILIAGAVFTEGCSADAPRFPVQFDISEGRTAQFPAIALTVEALRVRDSTSLGCLGGPAGCRDGVDLNVARGTATRQLSLQVAHTKDQAAEGINRGETLGYRFTLTAMQGAVATLVVDEL